MNVTSFNVNVTSEHPERLSAFYRNIVGLEGEEGMGEGAFKVAGAHFLIDGHSGTVGDTKEPQRVLINFFVEDLAAEQSRLEAEGVKFIRTAGVEPWGGKISTFVDPDGNYAQIIEFRPQ
ncbi:MAG: VOC family protein [Chloroflexi bacterium]|nr:VOC family protein [Chloroflexota bacterium]MDA1148211.1 VOC family protein [Chloroflexota bacterium]